MYFSHLIKEVRRVHRYNRDKYAAPTVFRFYTWIIEAEDKRFFSGKKIKIVVVDNLSVNHLEQFRIMCVRPMRSVPSMLPYWTHNPKNQTLNK